MHEQQKTIGYLRDIYYLISYAQVILVADVNADHNPNTSFPGYVSKKVLHRKLKPVLQY